MTNARDTMSEETKMAVMANDIGHIKRSVEGIEATMKEFAKNFVTQEEFKPIKQLVYGLVGLILVAVVGAVLVGIFRQP